MSLLCIRSFNSEVIHGELRERTRIVFSGACLSAIARNVHFQCSHISFGLEDSYTLSQHWDRISWRKLWRSKFRKFKIPYKRDGVLVGNYYDTKFKPSGTKVLFCGHGLKFFHPREGAQLIVKQHLISCQILFLAECPEGYRETSTGVLSRLNSRKGSRSKTALLAITWNDEQPVPSYIDI